MKKKLFAPYFNPNHKNTCREKKLIKLLQNLFTKLCFCDAFFKKGPTSFLFSPVFCLDLWVRRLENGTLKNARSSLARQRLSSYATPRFTPRKRKENFEKRCSEKLTAFIVHAENEGIVCLYQQEDF